MKKKTEEQLKYLKLYNLLECWDNYLEESQNKDWSYQKLLYHIIQKEYEVKHEKARQSRLNKAQIPIKYVLETFPFHKQPHLNKKKILKYFDSLEYLDKKRNMILIGPTGAGKSGLATSFLIHVINNGHANIPGRKI